MGAADFYEIYLFFIIITNQLKITQAKKKQH